MNTSPNKLGAVIALVITAVLGTAFSQRADAATAAQPLPGQAEVRLQAWQVRTVTDKAQVSEKLEPMGQLRPGDVVEYEARYVNGTGRPARDVQVTLPVPAGGLQVLLAGVTGSPAQSASLDGRTFEPIPLRRALRMPDGRRVVQNVPLSEYRYLRWNLGDLPAGAERAVRARMQLPAADATVRQ